MSSPESTFVADAYFVVDVIVRKTCQRPLGEVRNLVRIVGILGANVDHPVRLVPDAGHGSQVRGPRGEAQHGHPRDLPQIIFELGVLPPRVDLGVVHDQYVAALEPSAFDRVADAVREVGRVVGRVVAPPAPDARYRRVDSAEYREVVLLAGERTR